MSLLPMVSKMPMMSMSRLRRLSRILGPILVGAYPFLWAVGLFFVFCNDYSPAIRWCAGLAIAAPLVLAWCLFRRSGLPEGWYRPSKILVVCAALLCLVATPMAILGAAYNHNFSAYYCGVRGQQIAYGVQYLPVVYADDHGPLGTQPPPFWPVPGVWPNSNEYLAELLRIHEEPNGRLGAHDLIMCMGLQDGDCGWACLAGIGDCESEETPLLWTANLQVRAEDFTGADPAHPKRWRSRVDKRRLPRLRNWVVVIRKDGRISRIPDYALTDARFLGSSTNDPSHLEVLYPVPSTERAPSSP